VWVFRAGGRSPLSSYQTRTTSTPISHSPFRQRARHPSWNRSAGTLGQLPPGGKYCVGNRDRNDQDRRIKPSPWRLAKRCQGVCPRRGRHGLWYPAREGDVDVRPRAFAFSIQCTMREGRPSRALLEYWNKEIVCGRKSDTVQAREPMTVKEIGPLTVHARRPYFPFRIFANSGSCWCSARRNNAWIKYRRPRALV
jgi:hypothetical protein